MTILSRPQKVLVGAEESPRPGGFEKGVGNLFPDTPATKCGTEFARKTPEKKIAR
jgi:hypothetical protein